MDVTIIIVSYNTREMTIACIRSVIEQTATVRYELIVFENGSSDGSAEAIRSNFPQVHLITSPENLGFAAANNVAAKEARGRYLLLLNTDTVVIDHAIDRIYQFALANPECRIWGGRTLFPDGSLNPGSCFRFATPWSLFCWAVGLTAIKNSVLFNWEGYGGWKRDSVRAVDIVTGCFFLVDRRLWDKLHGFDPVFFMYGEEADLCLRARNFGGRPKMTPAATIIHYGGASYPDRTDRLVHLLAGRITLMRRHWSPVWYAVGRFLYRLLPLTRWLIIGTVATLSRNTKRLRTAHVWRDVWRDRERWIEGWKSDSAIDLRRGG